MSWLNKGMLKCQSILGLLGLTTGSWTENSSWMPMSLLCTECDVSCLVKGQSAPIFRLALKGNIFFSDLLLSLSLTFNETKLKSCYHSWLLSNAHRNIGLVVAALQQQRCMCGQTHLWATAVEQRGSHPSSMHCTRLMCLSCLAPLEMLQAAASYPAGLSLLIIPCMHFNHEQFPLLL